ncbi:MAG: 1-acyl-sn-glycerol-3-phosphate acyltransferase [Clostridia bacterium]|nr:1-acyl-sn-glycerol-3-phosphate acyltransferase [Clostridia bacterium]
MEQKRKKWMKFRHRVVRNIAAVFVHPYCRWKYGVKIKKFADQGDRQYLILMNHQTVFDQFFTGIAFHGPVYYIATEDIFSNGWVSSLIRYLVAPIPIKKQTMDVSAILNCLRVAKEGGTIALAPEGNRTYSGKTEYMSPAIAQLVKKLGLPVALFRIEGGYGVQPRWSDVLRRGRMHAYVSRVIEPEEYKELSNDALFELIREGLYVNEAAPDASFYHKKNAEYLERCIYVCPFCGLSEFESHSDLITCKTCGRQVRYLPTKEFMGLGFDFPFRFVNDWYEYQKEFINNLDTKLYRDTPLYRDCARLSEGIINQRKIMLRKDASIALYGDRIVIDEGREDELCMHFSDLSAVSVLGRNKLNIYHGEHVYQFKGSKRFNALKYVNIYFRYKNIVKGDSNVKFLGL